MKPIARSLILLIFSTFSAGAFGQFNFNNFCDVSDFSLNGITGSLNPNGECVLRLTNNFSQSGSAFLTNSISLAVDASFSTAFSFRFTNQQAGGADGIVFVVQTVANDVGGGGGGIGYHGIDDSVGVEFDNWFNSGSDPNDSHIGIDIDGSVNSVVTMNVSPDLDNGAVWYAWVDYNGATDLLEVRISESPARPDSADLSHTVDLVTVLGQTDAFIGFTSGTGSAAAFHDVLAWAFNPFFDPIDDAPEAARATFNVNKYFNDNNPAEVAVTISCDTGLPLEQTKMISQGHPVEFVVVDFDDGELDCDITEAVPVGYSANYESNGGLDSDDGVAACRYESVGFGDDFSCDINNSLSQVSIVVRKIWIDDNPQFNAPNYARARWNCYNSGYQIGADDPAHFGCDGDSCGSLSFYGADDTDSFYVYPDWRGRTWCTVEERVFESGVESRNNCGQLFVAPGHGNGCTITNTRFYEGIPTLSQYGLAILALLMLGVGMVGFRRFV